VSIEIGSFELDRLYKIFQDSILIWKQLLSRQSRRRRWRC
jgi:hypothetical protein